MSKENTVRRGRKPVYPDYISIETMDAMLKVGGNPLEMMADMKKALMERALEVFGKLHESP